MYTRVHMMQFPRNTAIRLIELYQKTLSPDHGALKSMHPYGFCRHEPTCSEYGKQILAKRGLIVGSILIIKRLLSCHPWAKISEEKVMKIASQKEAF
tara:strand:+ start:14073 stop:14363 length:291 start_codon:yes stop_codon:yes gene_type:complete